MCATGTRAGYSNSVHSLSQEGFVPAADVPVARLLLVLLVLQERSVATMLFLLCLQDVTNTPFRVVDEINQGRIVP